MNKVKLFNDRDRHFTRVHVIEKINEFGKEHKILNVQFEYHYYPKDKYCNYGTEETVAYVLYEENDGLENW